MYFHSVDIQQYKHINQFTSDHFHKQYSKSHPNSENSPRCLFNVELNCSFS